MSAEIHFLPLYGSEAEDPVSFLLRMDDCTILLDCGWSNAFDKELVNRVEPYVDEIDAVVISHASMRYMGGLPHLVSHLNLHCPVYCTIPVYRMGQMMFYNEFETHQRYSDFDAFDLDDIDLAFNACSTVKYFQTMELPSGGVSITAHPAGRTVGGSMWEIRRGGESMLYAVGYNHRRELHLEGCKFGFFKRPSAIITECNSSRNLPAKKLQEDLCQSVDLVLERGGKVLMPVDATGRVLELISVLHRHWVARNIGRDTYRLVFLSHQAYNTLEVARGQLEWMSKEMQKEFDMKRDNPFLLSKLYLCHNLEELGVLMDVPCVVMATDATLGSGLGQEVLTQIAAHPRNLVLLTQLADSSSVAGQLISQMLSSSSSSSSVSLHADLVQPQVVPDAPKDETLSTIHGKRKQIKAEFIYKRVVPLEGEELERFLQERADKKARQAEFSAASMDMSDSDDESGSDADDVGARELKRKKLRFTPMYPMFPSSELRTARDAFGDVIDREEFETPAVLQASEEDQHTAESVLDQGEAHDEADEAGDLGGEPEEEEEEELLRDATKTLFEPVVLSLNCGIKFIDFDGRSDGKSIRQFCKQMQPRRVILVASDTQAKEELRSFVLENKIVAAENMCNVPTDMQQISATSDLKIAKLHVDDDLFAQLHFTRIQGTGYDAAWVVGNAMPVENNPHLMHLSALAQTSSPLILQPEGGNGHALVRLGHVQLARVKHILNDVGIQADFASGGVLACGPNGQVQLEKVGKSKIRMRGALCPAYFQIRDLLNGELELV